MEFDKYEISSYSPENLYWFTSANPKGENAIMKTVRMQQMEKPNRYNLALGSVIDGKEDYEHQSKNKDIDKIFGTIGAIAEDFLKKHPKGEIHLSGNTAAKKRIYQMKTAENLDEIKTNFDVYGAKVEGGDFTEFKKGETYTAILISKK